MINRLFASLLLFATFAPSAYAWNATGHEQIADIAWTKLTPHTRIVIAEILLAGDPAFRPTGDNEEKLRSAFRHAATFPDVIKGDFHTSYESMVLEMNRKWLPNFNEYTLDREAFRCKKWHYYNTPIRYRGAKPEIEPSNALVALKFGIDDLKIEQKLTIPDRFMDCWWLYWVEHLVGDVHMPLHCVSSYEYSRKGDAGGNAYTIKIADYRGRDTSPLHGYWDEGIDHAVAREKADGLSYGIEDVTARWISSVKYQPSKKDVNDTDVSRWIAQGAANADNIVYQGILPGDVPSEEYRLTQENTCKKLAILAGYRLAAVLNSALK